MVVSSMSYATYERYKESGVDWLGAIPSDWQSKKLGILLTEFSKKNNPNLPLLSITRELGVITRDMDDQESNHNFIPDDLSGYKLLKEGQFGMNKMKAWQGSYGISKYTGIVSPAYYVFDVSNEIYPNFFNIAIRSKFYVDFFGSASDGVRIGQWDLNKTRMREIPFIFPSLEQQKKIYEFLSKKIKQIDQAIALKQQQIEKLGEYKQIVIQNAVTKGLNPNAKMKDSGVAWIGDIPEHWEMVSIKRIAKISPKVDLSNYKLDEKVTFLPMEKVSSNGDIDCEILKPIREVKQGFTAFKKNDVILAKITPCFENGKGALLDKLETEIGYGSTEFHVLRASKRIKAYYLYLITHSSNFLTLGEAMMTGSAGQKRVPTDFVANYQFPLPPMSEQQQIIEYVENLNRKISDTIQSYQTQIDRLKEYKNILINQAVTGKIKI